jgi:hypothetical protein
MMSEIQAGDGWRLIDQEKDEPREGDQRFIKAGEWADRVKWWELFHPTLSYRRRIPAKPEAMEIDEFGLTQATICTSGGVSLRQQDISGFGEYVFLESPEQIRKLGEWLISVAEWREAQDSK